MSRGFTLIELIVVIAIIGILTTISFPYYRSARQQLALQRAISGLVQDIRRAQEMAMSVAEAEGCFSNEIPRFGSYKYGFGIEFKTGEDTRDEYTLFGDCNGSDKYEGADDDMWLSLIDFNVVEIDSIDISGDAAQRLSITFTPPDPSVTFWAAPPTSVVDVSKVSIVLRVKNDHAKTKTVTINKAGLITIE